MVGCPSPAILQKSRMDAHVSMTIISGPSTGATIALKPNSKLLLGRSREADVTIADTGISRAHCSLYSVGERVYVEDLGSSNGTYLNGEKLTQTLLINNGDQVSLGNTTVLKFTYANLLDKEYQELVKQQLSKDALTNVYNRKALAHYLTSGFVKAKQYHKPISLIMVDIDHFKTINDTHGHQFGDEVLNAVADALVHTVRSSDYVCRYGGDEFSVVCPNSDIERAYQMAEEVREKIAAIDLPIKGKRVHITASIGVASYPENIVDSVTEFISVADQAMYISKRNGRNQTSQASISMAK